MMDARKKEQPNLMGKSNVDSPWVLPCVVCARAMLFVVGLPPEGTTGILTLLLLRNLLRLVLIFDRCPSHHDRDEGQLMAKGRRTAWDGVVCSAPESASVAWAANGYSRLLPRNRGQPTTMVQVLRNLVGLSAYVARINERDWPAR